ncbi:ABC transporter permease [Mycolicibacterium komossense]|uniref:ABC transporter permease n=1 Tax=Mycolicibacterium komossense TaxID=1779 RepID=A0ABT3C6J9_9MYCO|nr:ABC transporter permease [Mycolicibacterium komossense]MCV7225092.1 ABC transporter permease [Mycolicibacterium komossense]
MLSRIKGLDNGRYSIFLILAAVVIVASLLSPNFLTPGNATNVLRQVAVITILAYGAMMLIISGMIDLSAGAVMALAGVASVMAFKSSQSLVVAVIVGVLVGMACNLVNAFLVATLKTPAFIVTLGMMMVARGAVLELTDGQNILQLGDFVKLGQGSLGWLPLPTLFLAVITLIVWYVMTQTRYGRSLYAVGGNGEAARAAGIAVERVKYQAFLFNGALVGFAGVIFMARVNAGLPNAGVGYELQAITAPIIGGTSFSGGVGTTAGTLAGALIVGVLGNIMNLTGVGSYIQQIVMGVIIAAAVAYDVWSKQRRGRGRTIILHERGTDGRADKESDAVDDPVTDNSGARHQT